MRLEKLEDDQHTDYIIEEVTPYTSGDGWSIKFVDGLSFGVPGTSPVEPRVGLPVRLYGEGFGRPVRGMDIDGTEVFYKTVDEQKAEHKKRNEEANKKKKEKYEANKDDYLKRIAAMPEVYQRRFARFQEGNPDFDWDYGDYEMFVCEEAIKIAAYCKTRDAIREFYKAPSKPEAKIKDGMLVEESEHDKAGVSDGHSGNTFGTSCRLAMWYVSKPENVVLEHGALVPLVGCEKYGCTHPKQEEGDNAHDGEYRRQGHEAG